MDNGVLAKVNGSAITEKDIEFAISQFPQDRRGMLNTADGRKQMLLQMISYELLYNYAKDKGLSEDERVKLQVEAFTKQALIQVAISDVLSNLEATEEEAKAYYEAHKNEFTQGETLRASHILVSSLDECEKIREEILQGLSFEDAAKKYSSCPSKENGGDLGSFGRGMMVPEFDEAVFSLPVGEISMPVKTTFGYHLIKVVEKAAAPEVSFEESLEAIKTKLLQNKEQETYVAFTEDLKKTYKVEYAE